MDVGWNADVEANKDFLKEINDKLAELSEKGYVTSKEILEVLAPRVTDIDGPFDYEWPSIILKKEKNLRRR